MTFEPPTQLVRFLLELRKSILGLGLAAAGGTIALSFFSPFLLLILTAHLGQKLAFFTVAEPFLALVQLGFFFTLFAFMPYILYCIWRALAQVFHLAPASSYWFVGIACGLFYFGALFCYFITLPFGVKFLLGYESVQLKAVISVSRFVSFISIFVLGFGIIFELPLFMVLGAKIGLWNHEVFCQYRRHAILAITIIAAILTPTPDAVNMMLMGIPLYLLYEAGIVVMRFLVRT